MRLLLIEDDPKISAFVSKGFKEAGFVVEHAAHGEEGVYLATNELYDVAVIDIMLPRIDGLTIIEEMRRHRINTPVIILSAKRTVDDRIKGLQTGGDDYLTKPFSFAELLARVRALIRRASGTLEPTSLTFADLTINLLAREVKRRGKIIRLQPLEYSLLEYMMRNAGRIISKTMIMEHVWNYDYVPLTNVVEARICLLRDKVDKGFDKKLIHTVRGAGYVLKEDI
jgi:two-component system OmpR family response regulator